METFFPHITETWLPVLHWLASYGRETLQALHLLPSLRPLHHILYVHHPLEMVHCHESTKHDPDKHCYTASHLNTPTTVYLPPEDQLCYALPYPFNLLPRHIPKHARGQSNLPIFWLETNGKMYITPLLVYNSISYWCFEYGFSVALTRIRGGGVNT